MLSIEDTDERRLKQAMLTGQTPTSSAATSMTAQVNYGGPNPEDTTGGMGEQTPSPLLPAPPAPAATLPATSLTPTAPAAQPATPAPLNIGQVSGGLSDDQISQIISARPDIATEYQRAKDAADPNSPAFAEAGLGSIEQYTNHWYNNMGGAAEIAAMGQPAKPTAGGLTDQVKTTTDQVTGQIDTVGKSVLDQIGGLNTGLTNLIAQQNEQFKTAQTDLLNQFKTAQGENSKAMAELVAQMKSMQTGQAAKKPNYSQALARNKLLNSGGIGSTMLAGPGGVASTAMTLGRTSLLGG